MDFEIGGTGGTTTILPTPKRKSKLEKRVEKRNKIKEYRIAKRLSVLTKKANSAKLPTNLQDQNLLSAKGSFPQMYAAYVMIGTFRR